MKLAPMRLAARLLAICLAAAGAWTADVVVTVVDEAGKPVADYALLGVTPWDDPSGETDNEAVPARTDATGVARIVFRHFTRHDVRVISEDQAGFHRQDYYHFKEDQDQADWQHLAVTLHVKRIHAPVRMIEGRFSGILPAEAATWSIDLEAGDFLPPYGAGRTAHLAFVRTVTDPFHLDAAGHVRYHERIVIVTAGSGGGFRSYGRPSAEVNGGSTMRHDLEAPVTGYAQPIASERASDGEMGRDDALVNAYYLLVPAADSPGSFRYGCITDGFNWNARERWLTFTYFLNPVAGALGLERAASEAPRTVPPRK